MKYKYQSEFDFFIEKGYVLPLLYPIESKEAYRYVFADDIQRNHIPPHKLHPNRLKQQIREGRVDLNGFALSNFESEKKAISFYRFLHKTCRNAYKQIGDSLSFGILSSADGMITATNPKGHFDLFESEECNLNKTFKIIKPL